MVRHLLLIEKFIVGSTTSMEKTLDGSCSNYGSACIINGQTIGENPRVFESFHTSNSFVMTLPTSLKTSRSNMTD